MKKEIPANELGWESVENNPQFGMHSISRTHENVEYIQVTIK